MVHAFAAMYNISPAANDALVELLDEFSTRVAAARPSPER
jgi:hypothetical protein